jgi:hypothetical protein
MTKLTQEEMIEELDIEYSETYEGDEDLDLMTPEEYGEYINNLSFEDLVVEYNDRLGWMDHRELQ